MVAEVEKGLEPAVWKQWYADTAASGLLMVLLNGWMVVELVVK